jgi:hypothetical protein
VSLKTTGYREQRNKKIGQTTLYGDQGNIKSHIGNVFMSLKAVGHEIIDGMITTELETNM